MKKELHASVAGVRGIWGESLFPETAVNLSRAFGIYLKSGKIVLGRDTRTTSELLNMAAAAGLISSGCEVIDIGVCPTPTCQLSVKTFQADGGLIVTASHNPAEWNGLKFVNREGEFLNPDEHNEFMDVISQDKAAVADVGHIKPAYGSIELHQKAIQTHIEKISDQVDLTGIRKRRFHVVLDAVNGAGSQLLLPLLKQFECLVYELDCQENGFFNRDPEPRKENLAALCEVVKKKQADVGFAVDPDGDRLSLVTEKGEPLGEELTLPLVTQHVLRNSEKGSVVVTNLSTSMAIDEVAGKYDATVIRTKIGEAHVVSAMKKNNCIIGGEGNGGVIVPKIQYARDSGVGIAMVLSSLAETGQTLSKLADEIPEYVMVKKKLICDQDKIPEILDSLEKQYPDADIDRTDGIKFLWKERWLHVRKSGTEGLLRIFAEAGAQEDADQMIDTAINTIHELVNQ